MASGVTVRGLRELNLAFRAAGPVAKRELDERLREVAEPIRASAESFAASGIRRIGPRWSQMRVGVTQRLVYVAPRQRGVRARGPHPRGRPKFATLMEQRAFAPALERHEGNIARSVDELFNDLADDWNRRG